MAPGGGNEPPIDSTTELTIIDNLHVVSVKTRSGQTFHVPIPNVEFFQSETKERTQRQSVGMVGALPDPLAGGDF